MCATTKVRTWIRFRIAAAAIYITAAAVAAVAVAAVAIMAVIFTTSIIGVIVAAMSPRHCLLILAARAVAIAFCIVCVPHVPKITT